MRMPIETVIHTVRHGHTGYNAERRYAGSLDIPLSEKGIGDCRKAAPRLADYHFDVAITSAVKRSVETARLLLGTGVPLVQAPLCNERCFGVLEGRTWDDVLTIEPPVLLIQVGNDLHTVNPKGAEPFEDVWERAKKFRRFLFREYKGKSILVVSHGVFLQMFHGILRGSNCIESLASYPANLELGRFRFLGDRLTEDTVTRLLPFETELKF